MVPFGGIVATMAAVSWGLVYAFTQSIVHEMHPLSLLTATYFCAGLFSLVPYAFVGNQKDLTEGILSKPGEFLLYTVLIVVAKFFMIYSVKLIGATAAGLVEISYPIWTALVLYFWKHEYPDRGTIVGGSLIFAGMSVIVLTRQVVDNPGTRTSVTLAVKQVDTVHSDYHTFA